MYFSRILKIWKPENLCVFFIVHKFEPRNPSEQKGKSLNYILKLERKMVGSIVLVSEICLLLSIYGCEEIHFEYNDKSFNGKPKYIKGKLFGGYTHPSIPMQFCGIHFGVCIGGKLLFNNDN